MANIAEDQGNFRGMLEISTNHESKFVGVGISHIVVLGLGVSLSYCTYLMTQYFLAEK